MKSENDTSLLGKILSRLNGDLIDNQINGNEQLALLEVDNFSAKILSNYMTMNDVLQRGIFSLDHIDSVESFPHYQVIYFISPTKKSCDKIVKDFESSSKSPKFNKIHIFFTHNSSDDIFDILVSKQVIQRTKTCNVFNLSFFLDSDSVFDLRLNSGLQMFTIQEDKQTQLMMVIAQRLITVFANLDVRPIIQYQKSSEICTKLADILESLLTKEDFANKFESREAILLLCDRTMDLIAPLMHDYNYEAMTYDLLNFKEGTGKLAVKEKVNDKIMEVVKDTTLSLKDELWKQCRRKTIVEASNYIDEKIKELQQKAKANKGGGDSKIDAMLKSVSEIRALEKDSKMIVTQNSIISSLARKIKDYNIHEVIFDEQDIISQEKENGDKMNLGHLVKIITSIKSSTAQETDILRLLIIFFLSQNIPKKDFDSLCGNIIDGNNASIFDNLRDIFKINQDQDKIPCPVANPKLFSIKNKYYVKKNNTQQLRVCPQLQTLVELASNYQLDLNNYPIKGNHKMPTINKKSSNVGFFGKASKTKNFDEHLPYLIVFMVGGMCRNEVAALQRLYANDALKHNLIIGTTNFYTPCEFLDELRNLKKSANRVDEDICLINDDKKNDILLNVKK